MRSSDGRSAELALAPRTVSEFYARVMSMLADVEKSCAPGGIWNVSPEGKHIGTILTPERVANLTFGDPDWKTLYIAARTSIYKIRVLTRGLPCNSCSLK